MSITRSQVIVYDGQVRAIWVISLILVASRPVWGRTEFNCVSVERGAIQVDGLLDEWQGIRSVTKADVDPHDAALAIRCAYDSTALYVSIDVTDDRLIRTKQRTSAEDHLVLSFGRLRVEIYPSSAEAGASLWVSAKGFTVMDSLQRNGWSIELSVPLAKVPGWTKNSPTVPFGVEFHDADLLSEHKTQTILSTGDGVLAFSDVALVLKGFLSDLKLRPSDITLDMMANMDGEPGQERVLLAGRVLAVLSSDYKYLELPVASPKDLLEVRILDLAGEGKSSALVRYVEYGGGGSREVLSLWNLHAGEFVRTFAHEIGKKVGSSRLTDTWTLVPKKKGKGYDLIIKASDATGFSAATWNETPAEDMIPIILPWDTTKKQEIWRFHGDEVSGG
jgi:hypothetical protein